MKLIANEDVHYCRGIAEGEEIPECSMTVGEYVMRRKLGISCPEISNKEEANKLITEYLERHKQ